MRALGATMLASGLLLATVPIASADQVRDGQWAIKQFDVEKVWSVTRGEGIKVAVIDDGVDASNPDLAGQVLPGFDPGGKGREAKSESGHGTSMSALIAAKGHGAGGGDGVTGLAPGVKILPIYKNSASNSDAIPEGIRWAVDNGAKVINISQAGKVGNSKWVLEAIAYAASKDVLIVAGAGNDGAGLASPASAPGVLAVGAVDQSGKVWAKSNFGPGLMLTAPGVEIVSAGSCSGSQYCMASGTSDATAYVSAAAALVRAKYPNLTAGQVANRLVKSAKAPSTSAAPKLPDDRYGYGTIRPYEALTQDIPAGPAQGPLTKPDAGGASGSSAPSAAATAPGGTLPGGTDPGQQAMEDPGDFSIVGKGLVVAAVILVVLAVLAIIVIVVLVKASKRRRAARAGQPPVPPYGYPQAQPPYPNQPYGNQPPPQEYPPYGSQPPQQPPYQNPYGSGGNQ
ncbi:type VII secretion-associated serine protease mycosin [Kitasatospora gansuensis]|uniref:Type VII secretion-associated serine protease mycosin n=2 Tax=Kitasatospora TaxID=2063 RepID=A0A7W7WJD5_9ACTN|nr:S8 family serine peptidase [Kitasatospora gansuensis]MBB4949033.1 type VII secretion-associated serine protease mycosin [Kitasatospora gansuensis]